MSARRNAGGVVAGSVVGGTVLAGTSFQTVYVGNATLAGGRLNDLPVQVVTEKSSAPTGHVYIEDGIARLVRAANPDGPIEFAGPGEVLVSGPGALFISPASRMLMLRKLSSFVLPADLAPPLLPGAPPPTPGAWSLRFDFTVARAERYRVARPDSPAHVRLARLLYDLGSGNSERTQILNILATQAELGRAVGTSIKSIESALRRFRRSLVILTPGHRRYAIIDRDRLRTIAEG